MSLTQAQIQNLHAMGYEYVRHPFFQVCDKNSKILILGSFPSVGSIKSGFYYGDKSNRFWDVLPSLFGLDSLKNASIEEKRDFLLTHNIALWDIIKSCYKKRGDSSDRAFYDASIEVNNIAEVLRNAPIKAIFTTGKKTHKIYSTYCGELPSAHYILSSSGATRKPLVKVIWAYTQILSYLH